MRPTLIAGNWKMNHGPASARVFFEQWAAAVTPAMQDSIAKATQAGAFQSVVFPGFLSLSTALEATQTAKGFPFPLTVGAQNADPHASGAYTGEVSGPQLQELGIKTVLVGHSERRHVFGESLVTIAEKIRSFSQQGFSIVFCVGEKLEERQAGQTEAVLDEQLGSVFSSNPELIQKITAGAPFAIAYEPVWAIGTGLTATPEQAHQAHHYIRQWLVRNASPVVSQRIPLLYGGSVTPQNASELLGTTEVDGVLVGGASLKLETWLPIIDAGIKRALASLVNHR